MLRYGFTQWLKHQSRSSQLSQVSVWERHRILTGIEKNGWNHSEFICKSPKMPKSYWEIASDRLSCLELFKGNQVEYNEISPFGLYEQPKLPQALSQMTPRCPYRFISNSAAARTRRKLGALLETSQSKTTQGLGRHCQKAAFTSQESWSRTASLAPHLPTSAEFTNEPIRRHEFLFYLPGWGEGW